MSSSLNEGALITYGIDEVINVFSGMYTLTDMTQDYDPGVTFQRSGNQYWKPVQQQAVTHDGFDLSGLEDDVLELSVQGSLGEPSNTYQTLRADDVRDESSYRRAISAAAKRLKGEMEFRGLEKVRQFGSFAVTDTDAFNNTTNTIWDGLSSADARAIETEFYTDSGTCVFLNPTAYRAGGKELVTSTARFDNNLPTEAYERGYTSPQVVGIGEVYRHPKLGKQTGQATVVTVTGAQSFAPIATVTASNGSKVPFDNRFADVTVSTTVGVAVGDKFSIAGVKAVSLDEKIELEYDQTFTVASIVDGTTLAISPRPIALDDGALSDLEKGYANISTTFADTDTLVWLNTTTRQSNIFMCKDAMVLASSPIPLNQELFQNLHAEQFQVGPINGIIGFDGNLDTLQGKVRIALWYEWNVEKPEQCGVILDAQA